MKKLTCIVLFFVTFFAFSQDWKTTYEEAVSFSKHEDKPVILVFSGSDWCAPCIKLDKTIWQSNEFKEYAKENYILYRADFPRKKSNHLPKDRAKENNALADMFNPHGHFPLVVVLNEKEEVLGKIGFKKLSPDQYIVLLNSFIK